MSGAAEYLNCVSGVAAADDCTEKPYTVLMLCPQYIAYRTTYGTATCLAQVTGTSVAAAMAAAQDTAWADQNPAWADRQRGDPADFVVLMCVAGHHDDLCPGIGNWERPRGADMGAPAP